MSNTIQGCYDWPIDGGLLPRERAEGSDVSCSIEVAVQTEPAGVALIPHAFTVSFPDSSTSTASLTRIFGVDVFNGFSKSVGFVFEEGLELEVTPISEHSIEFPSVLLFPSDTQVFQNKQVSVGFGNLLTQTVVSICNKPSLLSAETFKMSLSGTGAFALQTRLQPLVSSFDCSNAATIKEFVVACDNWINDSPVDTDHFDNWCFRNVREFGYEVENNLIVFAGHRSRGNVTDEILLEVIRNDNGDLYSSECCREGDIPTLQIGFKCVVVEPDACMFLLNRQPLQLFSFEHIACLVSCSTDITTIKFGKLPTDFSICEVMQFGLIEDLSIESFSQTLVADYVIQSDSVCDAVVCGNNEINNSLHIYPLDYNTKYQKPLNEVKYCGNSSTG